MKVLTGKYIIIDKIAAIGKVNNQIATIFHIPFLVGALRALASPIREATNMCEPERGIPSRVPTNKIIAVGISLAKAVLGCNSVIVPTFLITPLPKTTIPDARLRPVNRSNKLVSIPIPTPTTIPTAFEQSLPARENAVQQITPSKMYEKYFSVLTKL